MGSSAPSQPAVQVPCRGRPVGPRWLRFLAGICCDQGPPRRHPHSRTSPGPSGRFWGPGSVGVSGSRQAGASVGGCPGSRARSAGHGHAAVWTPEGAAGPPEALGRCAWGGEAP